MKRLLLAVTTVVCLACVVGVAAAPPSPLQFQKPEDAVKYRKATFVIMQNHLGRIGAMVKGTAPYDAPDAAANAEIVALMSQLPFHAFTEGTAGNGEKDSAKPNIWTERPKFDEAVKKMQNATSALWVATKSNNLDTLKTAYGATTSSCKSCHDNFRAK